MILLRSSRVFRTGLCTLVVLFGLATGCADSKTEDPGSSAPGITFSGPPANVTYYYLPG